MTLGGYHDDILQFVGRVVIENKGGEGVTRRKKPQY